jgi:hypothetical protein
MAKIAAPGYHCPHYGYSTPSKNHSGCGTIRINTDSGKEFCGDCGSITEGPPFCRSCGKSVV